MTHNDILFVAFGFAGKQYCVNFSADLVRDLASGDEYDLQAVGVLVPQIQWQIDVWSPHRITENAKRELGKDVLEVLMKVSRMSVESMGDSTIPSRRLKEYASSATMIFNGSRRIKIMRVGYRVFPRGVVGDRIDYSLASFDPIKSL